MPLLYKLVTGSPSAAAGLLFLSRSFFAAHALGLDTLPKITDLAVLGIWAFAAIGSLTAASRCTWAFSRDGGIPGSQWWKVVNKKHQVPLNSLILSTVVCGLLGLIYLGNAAAFNAFTGGESRKASTQLGSTDWQWQLSAWDVRMRSPCSAR